MSAVPVTKTVLQFAANRVVFNPMEAMNMAVASEGPSTPRSLPDEESG